MARRFRIASQTAGRIVVKRGLLPMHATSATQKPIAASTIDGVGKVYIDPMEWSHALERFLIPVIRDLRDGLSEFSSSHAGGVVLSGQGAQLPGLPELISRHFDGAPVRLGLPRIAFKENESALPHELQGPGGCTLWGLLAYGSVLRARDREAFCETWWGRLRLKVQRVAASL